ncbi:MAG: Fic family protein [Patescibacteria group bacterium]
MATLQPTKDRIKILKEEYDRLRIGKESLLKIIDEAEIAESVYNSNAIENSTLTLAETEKIILEMEISRDISLREVFEAKNLARVIEYIRTKSQEEELTKTMILLLHRMLIENIDQSISGRFRKEHEYVRVGTHIAPAPEHIELMIEEALVQYSSDHEAYFTDKIANFHLYFETIHPFNDGNGRIGRVIINYQFYRLGFPGIIIRDKEKKLYYRSFDEYRDNKTTKTAEKVITLALTEALHKRIAYLKGDVVVSLVEYAKKIGKSTSAILNAAKRQTIPAFREKGVWKIGQEQ